MQVDGCLSQWKYHYAVYEHKLVTEEGLSYVRSFIVIKNGYGVIVRFTRLHRFVGTGKGKIYKPLYSDENARMHYVCRMLNHILIENREKNHVDHVFQIDRQMLQEFFSSYALEAKADGSHRSRQSIEKCVHVIIDFFDHLIYSYGSYVKMTRQDLYIEKEVRSFTGRNKTARLPSFEVRGVPEYREIFRDIPTKALQEMLNLSVRYYPEIAFALGLQAFAGLRPGEVCNVRQQTSSKGPGILFTYRDASLIKVQIDLTHEYAMRSDGVICGRIKKERNQGVYPAFLNAFEILYRFHLDYLKGKRFEKDYAPMFINSKGMAMTYNDYYGRFRQLTDQHLRPLMLHSSDPECRIFGQLLCENTLSPHALRHWFSVQLALRGEEIAQLQFWRGDTNPQSAFDYLQNKGELISELARSNQFLIEFLAGATEKNG